jgi:hypothetical protein
MKISWNQIMKNMLESDNENKLESDNEKYVGIR